MGGGHKPSKLGDPIFKFQDRGNGKGFHDQVGWLPWKIYKTPQYLEQGGVYGFGNDCIKDSGGVIWYYDNALSSEINTDLTEILKDTYTICGWFYPLGKRDYEDHSLSIGFGEGGYSVSTDRVEALINSTSIRNWVNYTFDTTNKLHHIAFVYYPMGETIYDYGIIKLYVDGIKRDEATYYKTVYDIIANPTRVPYIFIGGSRIEDNNWENYYYRGYIDDLCWFTGDIANGQDTYEVPTGYM